MVLNTQKMNVKDGGKQPLNFMKDKYMGWLGAEDGKTRRNPEGNDDSAEGERGGCQWTSDAWGYYRHYHLSPVEALPGINKTMLLQHSYDPPD